MRDQGKGEGSLLCSLDRSSYWAVRCSCRLGRKLALALGAVWWT